METGLRNRTVLVTEVGNPLGISSALAFAREGANLILGSCDNGDALREAERAVLAAGAKAISGVYDAGNEEQVKAFARKGCDHFGRIDVLVNNVAGAGAKQSLTSMSFSAWKRSIHVGLTGCLFICRAVLPSMIERRWGRVIQFIGLQGFVGGDPATSAVHMGLVGLTRGIATQYGKSGVTANCIGYGGVDGIDNFPNSYPPVKLNDPLERTGTSQEVSSAAVYLASNDAGYITGQCYLVNGGKNFL